jgi:predicted Zn-dependent protease
MGTNDASPTNQPGASRNLKLTLFMLLFVAGILTYLVFKTLLTPPPPMTTPGAGGSTSAGGSAGAAGSTAGSPEARTKPVDTINLALSAIDDYMRQGRYVDAGVIADRACAKFPDDSPLRQVYAAALIGQERFADALTQMEEAVRIGPPTAKLYFDTGVIANQAGKPARAAELFNLAAMKDPTEAQYPLFLGMVQIKLGEEGPGAASLSKALRLNNDIPQAWGTLAELSLKANTLDLALDQVSKARALQPESVQWRNVEAKIHKRNNQPQKAVDLLAGLNPEDLLKSGALQTLAESYGMMGRPLTAAKAYANAASYKNNDPLLFLEAAKWFKKGGDLTMARSAAQVAVDFGHAPAREFLATLEKPTTETKPPTQPK